MRNYNKTIGALAAITALSAGVASAEIEGEVFAGYASSYNFRGLELGDNLAEAGVNLSSACPVTKGKFMLDIWYGSTNDDTSLVDDQLNAKLGWAKELGFVDVEVGYIHYDVKGSIPAISFDTGEFYLNLSKELYQGIRAGVTGFYDIDVNDGWYFEGALSKSIEITACAKLNLAAGASFYSSYTGIPVVTEDGFNHWFVSAALPVQVRDNLVITPYVRYVDVASDQFSGGSLAGVGTGADEVIGGIRANISF